MNTAVRALSAQQAVIANIGNNIANVNTPNYARRILTLETSTSTAVSSGVQLGSGVEVGTLIRSVDEYLNQAVREQTGNSQASQLKLDFLSRIEPLFDLTGQSNTIGSALTGFFNSVNSLATNPSSIELRADVLERATDLVQAIKNTYGTLASLQTEADRRIQTEIDTVNSITSQIAELNGVISRAEAAGGTAADERDKRDYLLEKLSEKISFNRVENSDGTVTLSLKGGFTLVNTTTARMLETTTSPSFLSGAVPPSLDGGALSFIVFNYDQGGGEAHVDLTAALGEGSGTIGGLLDLRGIAGASDTSAFEAEGILVNIASRVEGITRELLTTVNAIYAGEDPPYSAGDARDLDGAAPDVFGLFNFEWDGDEADKDVDGDGVAELSDITDSTVGVDNFSSRLMLSFTDPRRLAAARSSAAEPAVDPGNAENLLALADLQEHRFSFSVGNYALDATFGQSYNETVTYVGNATARTRIDASVAQDSLTTAANRRDEISGVSLDEEFTALIKYQQAYEASARMIRTAQEMIDEIVRLL